MNKEKNNITKNFNYNPSQLDTVKNNKKIQLGNRSMVDIIYRKDNSNENYKINKGSKANFFEQSSSRNRRRMSMEGSDLKINQQKYRTLRKIFDDFNSKDKIYFTNNNNIVKKKSIFYKGEIVEKNEINKSNDLIMSKNKNNSSTRKNSNVNTNLFLNIQHMLLFNEPSSLENENVIENSKPEKKSQKSKSEYTIKEKISFSGINSIIRSNSETEESYSPLSRRKVSNNYKTERLNNLQNW